MRRLSTNQISCVVVASLLQLCWLLIGKLLICKVIRSRSVMMMMMMTMMMVHSRPIMRLRRRSRSIVIWSGLIVGRLCVPRRTIRRSRWPGVIPRMIVIRRRRLPAETLVEESDDKTNEHVGGVRQLASSGGVGFARNFRSFASRVR